MPQTQDHMAVQKLVLYKAIPYCFAYIGFQQKFYKLLTSLQFCNNVLKKRKSDAFLLHIPIAFLWCVAIIALNLP